MIELSEIKPVGKLLKPHGISGEIVAQLDVDIDLSEPQCIILDVEGIFVPFFVSSVRPKSSETDLITVDDVTDETMAAALCGKTIYVLRSDLEELLDDDEEDDEDGFYADDFLGFKVDSVDGSLKGTITGIDTATENYLFIIESEAGKEVYVPVAEEFIASIDPDNKTIEFDLPEGLVDL